MNVTPQVTPHIEGGFVWQGGRAEPGEHEARQQAMADLQRRAKQPGAALDTQPEDEQDAADRPSEWAGFIYNPYSGDLLPPEDDEDEDEQDPQQPGSTDPAYGPRRCETVCMCVGTAVMQICACLCHDTVQDYTNVLRTIVTADMSFHYKL